MAGLQETIHAKITELALSLGRDAHKLGFDEEIPAGGYLDSAATMELILWLESEFDLMIPQEDLTLENFGTINTIAAYIGRKR